MDSEAYPQSFRTVKKNASKVINDGATNRKWRDTVSDQLSEMERKISTILSILSKHTESFENMMNSFQKLETQQREAMEKFSRDIEKIQEQGDTMLRQMEANGKEKNTIEKTNPDVSLPSDVIEQEQQNPTAPSTAVPTPTTTPATEIVTKPTPTPGTTMSSLPTLTPSTDHTKKMEEQRINSLEQRVQQLESHTSMIGSELESLLHPQTSQEGGSEDAPSSIFNERLVSFRDELTNTNHNVGKLFTYLYMRDRLKKDVILHGKSKHGKSLRIRLEEIPYSSDQLHLPKSSSESVSSNTYSLRFV